MFIELVDALRCPNAHAESWLILSATNIESRHVRDGLLGCPVCRAEYPIRDGVADFRGAAERTNDSAPDAATTSDGAPVLAESDQLAAMLNLADSLGFAVLIGSWASHADALLQPGDCPPLMLVDPPSAMTMGPGLSGVRTGGSLPIALGAARAVATDSIDAARLESAVRATRPGGRIVAPIAARLPEGVTELARDDAVWVASRDTATSPLVTLHVRRG